jgi:phenylalanyl-tRNA synthetase beta chain
MKAALNWLKQYVDFDWSPEELGERLTMLGLEVESVQKLGGEFEGIVVAQVITKDKHPNADKLTLCRVNDGTSERQIVCGAHNFEPGDKVPLILPGYSLPAKPGEQPALIKVGKIRGIESFGMMCSPNELGLGEDAAGLLVLSPSAPVGQPLAEYLGRAGGEVVYDLEITPNRPDLNSVIGIAREIAALTGNPLKMPTVQIHASRLKHQTADLVAVRIEDPDLCPRYTARVVCGVKIGPSPDWLCHSLEKVGLRSINNVVDVTNYVMLEIGQPLHAFDYHLVACSSSDSGGNLPTIVVRRAAEGERFTTLDGQDRALTSQMLVIADETKAIALAGVMGGLNTEINDKTVDVLIESACFKPQSVRAASKKLDLRSDASYRFERGSDIGICDWASLRCAQLILETAGGQLADGVVDAYPRPAAPRTITLRYAKTDQLLGIAIPPEQQINLLCRLGLEVVQPAASPASPGSTTFCIPTFRVDLKRETDLIEEIARLYGVDKIPARTPVAVLGSHPYDTVHDQLAEARRILTGLGLDETQGQTLLSVSAAKLVVREANSAQLVELQNPLSADMNLLRPSLLPGLLDVLQRNLSHKNSDLALFEIGRVFTQSNNATSEERRLAIALTGQRLPQFWSGAEREAKFDIYDLKGLIEEFLAQFGVGGLNYATRGQSDTLFLESAVIQLGDKILGELGQLLLALAKRHDLRDPVLLAELNLDLLLTLRNTSRTFKTLPAYPTVRRDVAMLVPESVTHRAVLEAVKRAKPLNLELVELFDVFRGKNVPAGQKSLAYAFTYRHMERTLTDAEVNAAHEKLVACLKASLPATIREGQPA